MKKALSLLAALALILSISACGGGSNIRDDVKVTELSEMVSKAVVDNETMISVDDNYLKNLMQLNKGISAEHIVMVNPSGTKIGEYGIFKGGNQAETKELAKEVDTYLKMVNDNFMEEYNVEERPKVRDAEYKTVGNYVMYAILSESEKTEAFKIFEKELSAAKK